MPRIPIQNWKEINIQKSIRNWENKERIVLWSEMGAHLLEKSITWYKSKRGEYGGKVGGVGRSVVIFSFIKHTLNGPQNLVLGILGFQSSHPMCFVHPPR